MVDQDGGARRALSPRSESKFFFADSGGQVAFFQNDQGAVTHLVVSIVEGDFKAVRRDDSAKR